ncbi:MAG TPA: dihydrolipoyllysine-residue succinyltransferase [Verrucomicrobiae bacterium]|jgi:2-oxoglutarate dehydrogenase E2 component (dihydrolipoamide succinyltransferase)
MPVDLIIPSVGESITEVQIAEWLKKEGDEVKKDENVAVIDSEKTTLELPAPENGRLRILRQAGETIPIGTVVGRIELNGEPAATESKEAKAPAEKKKAEAPEPPKEKAAAKVEKKKEPAAESPAKPAAKPARALQAEKPVPAATPKEGERVVPMTMLRRTAARRLVEAKQHMAMLTTFNEVDMGAVQILRKEVQEKFEKRHGIKLGFMSFFVNAVAVALKEFTQLNAEIRGNDIVYHERYDIGVAIASDRGLVVPVLREADKMSFDGVEKAIGDYAKRSREGKLKPQELEGGTFTITNGGVFGSLLSTPIINPPQTGILGMHSIQERPMAVNGQVVIRPMMYTALTYDHRLVDGREAVMFLRRLKEIIEAPSRVLIEG